MKRTSFIAPVESMRGNLSGKQDLRYANENNKAFDAPEGRQYARNYRASYIGARRSKDGLTYFAVKTKSATKIDAASLNRMACLGATGAMVGSILSQKSSTLFENLLRIYGALQIQGIIAKETSLRKWLFGNLYMMYASKMVSLTLEARVGTTTISALINNPYLSDSQTTGAEISQDLLVKFWVELGFENIKYRIKNTALYILGKSSDTFNDIISSAYNILSLRLKDTYVVVGVASEQYLCVTKSSAVDEPFALKGDDDFETSGGGEYFINTTNTFGE